jgi:hypothetical protein
MPYIARWSCSASGPLLSAMSVSPDGLVGDLVLTPTFAFLALATYRAGWRAPALSR